MEEWQDLICVQAVSLQPPKPYYLWLKYPCELFSQQWRSWSLETEGGCSEENTGLPTGSSGSHAVTPAGYHS